MASGTRCSNRNQPDHPPAPLFNIPDPPKIKAPPRKKPAEQARPTENAPSTSTTAPVVPPSSPPAVPPPAPAPSILAGSERQSPSDDLVPGRSPSPVPLDLDDGFEAPSPSSPSGRFPSGNPLQRAQVPLPRRNPQESETALKSNVFSMPKALSPEPSLFSSHATANQRQKAFLGHQPPAPYQSLFSSQPPSPVRKRFAGPSSRPAQYSPSRSPSPTGDVKPVAGPSAPPACYAPSRLPSPTGGREPRRDVPCWSTTASANLGSGWLWTMKSWRNTILRSLSKTNGSNSSQREIGPLLHPVAPAHEMSTTTAGLDDSGDERPHLDDEEEEEWSVKPGPPPKAAVEEAARGLKTFLEDLRVIAKANHTRVATLAQAAGVMPHVSRMPNRWGAYQFWSRVHTPKTEDMTNEQWAEMVRVNYRALIENLPDDERKDPEALQRVMQPYLDFMEQATIGSNDERKSGRGGVALMEKALRPMIQQSSVMSDLRELEVMGICVDFTVSNNRAIAWGGSDLYDEMKRRYPVALEKLSAQWVDLLEKTRADMKQEASGLQPRPNPVHVSLRPAPGKRTRDFIRSQFTSLALNTAYLTLMERDDLNAEEARAKLGQMPWGTFADAAVSHKLCWLGWPNALKARGRHPGPGFSFTSFKNKASTSDEKGNEESETAALREACALMLRAYQGEDVPDAPYVGSWPEADIELEDPTAVPIVICQDGTVLLRAGDSNKLLNRLSRATTYKSGTKKQPASKNKSGSEKNAPSGRKRPRSPADDEDEDDQGEDDDVSPQKRRRRAGGNVRDGEAGGNELETEGSGSSKGKGKATIVIWKPPKTCRFFSDKGGRRTYSTTFQASGYSLVSPDDMSAAENHIEVEMRPGTWIQLDSARLAFSQFQAAIMNGAYADIAHDDD
ncbi:hypothetical protein C8F01DRAFT_1083644 [Mycena amicta]|nr:hypothetical protein C8F01DRAFT_1083644 [Mycena amicta]